MAKQPTLQTITSGYGSTQLINNNFQAIYDQFLLVLSRDGSLPNAMAADLDMGGNDIINVGTISYSISNFSFEKSIFISGTPVEDETLYMYVATFNLLFPVNFARTYARVETDPTSDFVLSVQKNGTEIGTITFSNGSYVGVLATTGTSAQRSFAPGDILKVVAPATADATIENIAISFIAEFS